MRVALDQLALGIDTGLVGPQEAAPEDFAPSLGGVGFAQLFCDQGVNLVYILTCATGFGAGLVGHDCFISRGLRKKPTPHCRLPEMLEIVKALFAALLSLGPLGVVVAGMSVLVWRLHEQLSRVQEQRVKDAFRIAETANSVSNALERNTETLKALLEG